MDLSVLKGDDPAGYKVEAKIKANKGKNRKGELQLYIFFHR